MEKEIINSILNILKDKKAADILLLDTSNMSDMSRYQFICSGQNTRHNFAISQSIIFELKKTYGIRPISEEGSKNSNWILLNYDFIIVHIFLDLIRSHYDLENLWKDAKICDSLGA